MQHTFTRRWSKPVRVGELVVGGNAPITVQSMTNIPAENFKATLRQVQSLERAGCDIVRLAVPTKEAAPVFAYLKENGIRVPLVADIHFDYKIALEAISAGADKIRINPGNIGSREKTEQVVRACKDKHIPIRIGVNSGSLEKSLLEKFGGPTPEALAESAMGHVQILEALDFEDIVISVKSSNVPGMIQTNRLLAEMCPYALHLGVTEAGGLGQGIIKGAVGIGALLAEGIGDTVRVSLTADPVEEVKAAQSILHALGLGKPQMDIVSCPTCGRTKINLLALCEAFEKRIDAEGLRNFPVKVALMGCAVNGPGEAKEADVGIAGGIDEALLFRHGVVVAKYPADQIVDILTTELKNMKKEREHWKK